MVKPLVVLVHGTHESKAEWDGYDALLPDVEVLAIDLPGHGDATHQRCTRSNVLAAFEDALAQAEPGQPVVLVGHSLGGYFSALYANYLADEGRDDLAALVLVGTTADPSSLIALGYKGFLWLISALGVQRMTTISNAFYRLIGNRGELPGQESYQALADGWRVVFDECGPANLRDVQCPVVLVNGQFDQMRVHAKRFANQASNVSAHVLRGATHQLPKTHPAKLAAIIDGAVAEVRS